MSTYQKLIPILRQISILPENLVKDLVFEIARLKPSLVLKAADNIGIIEDTLEEKVKNMAKRRSKVHAIKLYHQMTGVTIKDAKNAVDRILAQNE